MIQIQPICAFADNYIWIIIQGKRAAVVDPGDAMPVLTTIAKLELQLDGILITHHHSDHIGGVSTLQRIFPEVLTFAPSKGAYKFKHIPVKEGDVVSIPDIGTELQVIETPGHTLDHISYYGDGILFCGDTLFGAGCGRIFEGTPEQLYASLQRISLLPPDTKIYCTHEYTANNIRFALGLEPNNNALLERDKNTETLLLQNRPSLPSTLSLELSTNPFLRCHLPQIAQAVGNVNIADAVSTFVRLRALRNQF